MVIKVVSVIGTRPETIKMIPILKELDKDSNFESKLIVTGQHREMLKQVLDIFNVVPDYDLNVMSDNQTLTTLTSKVLNELSPVLKEENPDIMLVHGDTTTTLSASLSAFYHKVPVGHVEAGLRTWDKDNPYPEEMNRQMTDVLADLYFVPTTTSKKNLIKENHPSDKIFVTGNTAIDALKHTIKADYKTPILEKIKKNHRIILVTMHRNENQGQPMINVFRALKEIINTYEDVEVVFPVHLNPNVQRLVQQELKDISRIHLIKPMNIIEFHNLVANCYFIMTDSGGIQEEAPSLGKPVLVLRETTERPEGVDSGTLKLVGTNFDHVKREVINLLEDQDSYKLMAKANNPYGDGEASGRILKSIKLWQESKNKI